LWEYAEALILPHLLRRLAHAAPGMSITTSQVKRRDLETELANGKETAPIAPWRLKFAKRIALIGKRIELTLLFCTLSVFASAQE
jgi:hypothetical protein